MDTVGANKTNNEVHIPQQDRRPNAQPPSVDPTEIVATSILLDRFNRSISLLGLSDNKIISDSLDLALLVHENDIRVRSGAHYIDHILRVALRLIDDFNIVDPDIIAAALLHDTVENHPDAMAGRYTPEADNTPETARDTQTLRLLGFKAIEQCTNLTVADLVSSVTNPLPKRGKNGERENKIESYARHTEQLIKQSPDSRIIKLADFIDNSSGDLADIDPDRQLRLDLKYINLYVAHARGLYLPDSLIAGAFRVNIHNLLWQNYVAACARLKRDPSLDGWPEMIDAT